MAPDENDRLIRFAHIWEGRSSWEVIFRKISHLPLRG